MRRENRQVVADESYVEDLANHNGPESYADVRKGGGEALTGETCRLGIEPRKC